MKKVAICMIWLVLSACSGIVKHTEDTFWPFDNPNAPKGESENMRRIRGESVVAHPIVTEKGDIWPGQPDPVPTLQDVSNPDSHFNETFHRSLKTLNDDLDKQPFEDGESLSIGEEVSTRNGVRRNSSAIGSPLPSNVEDNAPAYLQGPNHDTVAIPNGDGTTTMVAPDGSVTIVRGTPDTPQKAIAADKGVDAEPLSPVAGKKPQTSEDSSSSLKKKEAESPKPLVPAANKLKRPVIRSKAHRRHGANSAKKASAPGKHRASKGITHKTKSAKSAHNKHSANRHSSVSRKAGRKLHARLSGSRL